MSYGKQNYDTHSTAGSAYLTIVASENSVSVMVDDKVVKTAQNVALTNPGYLAYVVVSGTNKSYGTKCVFEETEIYLFD